MKIIQIGTIDKSGGAANISWSIKSGMEKMGEKVSMFVADKLSKDKNVYVIPRKVHRYVCYLASNDIDLFNTTWVTKTETFKNSDIVHLHNLHGYYFKLKTLISITSKKPTVWTIHDMWPITAHCACPMTDINKKGFYVCKNRSLYPRITWPNEKYLTWRKKSIYEKSNFEIVAPSKWMYEKLKRSVLGNKKIHLIYNGINEKTFRCLKKDQTKIRSELGLPLDKKILLFISDSEQNKLKGIDYLEKLIENESRNDVIFISVGGYKSKNDKCINIGKINNPKLLAKYYNAADLFIYPSLADSFGLVVAESMSCGTPVLTFNTGGIPEIVGHKETGYVAHYRDAKDLKNGLNYLLKLNKSKYDNMSIKCAQKIRENFTESRMIQEYAKLYKKMTENE
jgi:glycosyltransferase involved in cell wall biosynthesis